MWRRLFPFLVLCLCASAALGAPEVAGNRRPVKAVADKRLEVGGGELPLYVSRDWSVPLPGVTRAVVVLHGRLRDADVYYKTALKAQAAAGAAGRETIMIVPQFLAGIDVEAFHLPESVLHWSLVGWEGGDAAKGPAPVSSFEAVDAILARLADRERFPDLQEVVVAGHSGGGQVVQRYAILGRGEAALGTVGVTTRYVVANPSSYAWFTADRPEPAIAAYCHGYNDWKYGMKKLPPYAQGTPAALEKAYIARRVIYLLGTADIDPNQSALDKSCMAEAQGPTRFARGHAYFAAMQAANGAAFAHRLVEVPGVGHDGEKMLTSACGLASVFDVPGCGQ